MPVCYLVSEITIERDNSGQQISSDISICGVFTTKDKANSCVTTWHDREYVFPVSSNCMGISFETVD